MYIDSFFRHTHRQSTATPLFSFSNRLFTLPPYLFIYFGLAFLVLHPQGICRPVQNQTDRGRPHINDTIRKSSDPSVRGAQSSRDGAPPKGKTKGKGPVRREMERYKMPYRATLSSTSHAIHTSSLAAWASSTSSFSYQPPPPTTLKSARVVSPTERY